MNKDLMLLIKYHSKRLGVALGGAIVNLLIFSHLVGIMENDGKLVGKNPDSTAKGLYQFIDGSVGPAVNRVKRAIGNREWLNDIRDVNELDKDKQTILFLGDMLEKRGSDKYMKRIMEDGDKETMRLAYLKLHHTNPDKNTLARSERIFNGDNYENRC